MITLSIRHSIVHIVLMVLFVAGCSLQRRPEDLPSSEINWQNLQVTPQSRGALCLDISARKEPSWEDAKRETESGLFTAIYPADPAQSREIGDSTFSVDAYKPQTINLRLWYPKGNERSSLSLRMFLLLDDKQLSGAIGEEPYYDVELQKGSETTIQFRIPPLEPGNHDVIAVAISYPQDYPNPEGTVVVIAWRMTFIVPPASSTFKKISFESFPAEALISAGGPKLVLELMRKQDKFVVWNWPNPWLDIDANSSIEFFALAAHEYVDNLDAPSLEKLKASFFSLLFFIDYQQIEIAPDETAIYGKVGKDTAYTRIPITIKSPPAGKHDLLVLRIDSPGVPICILKGDSHGRILPNSVYGKLVGINVLPPK